jgi:N,N'-diacetyllegionaminate synthase
MTSPKFAIQSRVVGDQAPCLIIGEVAQAHDGSLGTAHAYIDAVADAGADAVKFQTHIADAESTPAEPWRVRFSRQDATRFDYWRRMEFTSEQWSGLKTHAEERGLIFISSPFSLAAARLLNALDIGVWKIASGELGNGPLLDFMIETGKPVLASTGMSDLTEIDMAIQRLRSADIPFGVLQCTSMYPTPPEKLGLHLMREFAGRYGCVVGLSDHSGVPHTSFAAVTLGAKVLELHVTFSRECFGPDVVASLTTSELKEVVKGVRFIERALNAQDIAKDELAHDVAPLRLLFTKSLVAANDLPAGTVLTHEHVELKKPGGGLDAAALERIIGRRLRSSVRRNDMIEDGMLEENAQ